MCMCASVCVHVYAYVSACIHMRICVWVCVIMCVYVRICMCMYVYAYLCTYIYVCVCMYVCMYVYIHMCIRVCMFVYMFLCICVCICVCACAYERKKHSEDPKFKYFLTVIFSQENSNKIIKESLNRRGMLFFPSTILFFVFYIAYKFQYLTDKKRFYQHMRVVPPHKKQKKKRRKKRNKQTNKQTNKRKPLQKWTFKTMLELDILWLVGWFLAY